MRAKMPPATLAGRSFAIAMAALLSASLLPPPALAGKITTLLAFDGPNASDIEGSLAQIGTALIGASSGASTVNLFQFPIDSAGPLSSTVIHRFTGLSGEGAYPQGGIVLYNGALFGSTSGGGDTACPNGCGTVFQLTPPAIPGGAWSETQLLVFKNGNSGFAPSGPPVAANPNTLYATASHAANDAPRPGSAQGPVGGVVFRLTRPAGGTGPWTQKIIHHFEAAHLDGDTPAGKLTLGPGGVLYGVTFSGGKCNQGTVFQLTPPKGAQPGWAETLLHEFGATATGCDYDDGEQLVAGLTAVNGVLYGTTRGGTSLGCGTAFAITPGAVPVYQKIYVFGQTSADACSPQAPVRVDAKGVVFGSTAFGGGAPASTECAFGCGAIYALTPQAAGQPYQARVIYGFSGGTDGSVPRTNLIGSPGSFLTGITSHGGVASDTGQPDYTSFGTLFRIRP